MRSFRSLVLALLLVLGFVALCDAATTATASFRLGGAPPIVLSTEGSVEVVAGEGVLGGSKKAVVVTHTIAGATVNTLLRFQVRSGTLYVDLCSAASIGSLSARVTAMDLSTVAPSHPSPTRDSADNAAIVAAGG